MNLNTLLQWGGLIAILLIVSILAAIRIIRFIKSMRSSDGPPVFMRLRGLLT